MLTEVSVEELILGNEYYMLKKQMCGHDDLPRIDGYLGIYSGTIGVAEDILRFTDIHKGTRKFGMEIMPIDTTSFYVVSSILPRELFIGSILPFI